MKDDPQARFVHRDGSTYVAKESTAAGHPCTGCAFFLRGRAFHCSLTTEERQTQHPCFAKARRDGKFIVWKKEKKEKKEKKSRTRKPPERK
jgi:hypothetical protein